MHGHECQSRLFLCWLSKQLHTIVTKVCNNYISLRGQCQAMRIVQLPVPIPLCAKFANKATVAREHLNAMIVSICDNNISIMTHRDTRRAH